MVHEVESMFSVRNVPWHGLGKVLDYAPDSEQALIQAGLLWGVEKRELFLRNGQRVSDTFANVRMTDNRILGIVGSQYQIVQNREAFMWADDLLGKGAVYETAGSLREGRRIWLCANDYFASRDPVRSEAPYHPFLVMIPPIRRGIPPVITVCS